MEIVNQHRPTLPTKAPGLDLRLQQALEAHRHAPVEVLIVPPVVPGSGLRRRARVPPHRLLTDPTPVAPHPGDGEPTAVVRKGFRPRGSHRTAQHEGTTAGAFE
eukprot:4458311-Alexandrium_andersonii.AAC.1